MSDSKKKKRKDRTDYDHERARRAGITRDPVSGHSPSRVGHGADEGRILKGSAYHSFDKTLSGERRAGMNVVQRGDTLFSYAPSDPRLQLSGSQGRVRGFESGEALALGPRGVERAKRKRRKIIDAAFTEAKRER